MMKKTLTNPEIAAIATLILGGDKKHIDLEDVAIKVDEIAPHRFLWKKYKKYIDKDLVRHALADSKKLAHGNFVTGSDANGWMLTQKGVVFAKKHLSFAKKHDLSRPRIAKQEREWLSREYLRLIESDAYSKYLSGAKETITYREAERFFRISEYVTGTVRQERVARLQNIFGDHAELGEIVKYLADKFHMEEGNDKQA